MKQLPNAVSGSMERISADGSRREAARAFASEVPVAIEVNGIGYAVMMATPSQLEDFATGFLLSERLAGTPEDIRDVETHHAARGIVARVTLAPSRAPLLADRVRHRTTDSACGMCGIENLEAALRPLPRIASHTSAGPDAVFAALAQLRVHQPLNGETGAVHAAALCAADGGIRLVREDVGRHNAFDKLIGAMARTGASWNGGFALLTSRCSYELVEKAALADCPLLATISAPTALAVDRARESGVALAVLARADALLWLAEAG